MGGEKLDSSVIVNIASEYGSMEGIGTVLAAWGTRYLLHEVGHVAMAQRLGAEGAGIQWGGQGIDPLSYTYRSAPSLARLSIVSAGLEMDDIVFQYALYAHQKNPSSFNKALMFFSNINCLAYTLTSTLSDPDNSYFDPNAIRHETGLSKTGIIALAAVKTLLNSYKMYNPQDARIPISRVFVDPQNKSVGLMFTWTW